MLTDHLTVTNKSVVICKFSSSLLHPNNPYYRPGVAQRVGRGIALLFHDRGTRRGWVVSSTPRPHFTPGKDPVPILQEAGCAPGPVWTGGKSRPHRDTIPHHPARSQYYINNTHVILFSVSTIDYSNINCNNSPLPSRLAHCTVIMHWTGVKDGKAHTLLIITATFLFMNCIIHSHFIHSQSCKYVAFLR